MGTRPEDERLPVSNAMTDPPARQRADPDEAASRVDLRAPLRVEVAATVPNARVLRWRFQGWASVDLDPDVVNDLVMAVYEAAANAIEHAYINAPPGTVRLEARRYPSEVMVTVSDRGRWSHEPSSSVRGRGIAMMNELVDEVQIESGEKGSTVELMTRVSG